MAGVRDESACSPGRAAPVVPLLVHGVARAQTTYVTTDRCLRSSLVQEGGGGGFDDYGGELSIHSFDFSSPSLEATTVSRCGRCQL
jgi:hypothetical protein